MFRSSSPTTGGCGEDVTRFAQGLAATLASP